MSFLPQEVLQAGNVGPVVPPKFEFFDPSATSTLAQPEATSQPEVTTVVKDTVKAADNSNNNINAVELKFNGNNDVVTENNKPMTSTSAAEVAYQSTGTSSAGSVDITVSSIVPSENSSTEPKPTVVAIVEKTPSTLSSEQTSTSGATETTSGQVDSSSTISTDTTSTAKQMVEAGGIAIPSFAMGDLNTGGMLVKVGMGADNVQPTQDSPTITSQANIPQESSPTNDVSTSSSPASLNLDNLVPIATLVRSTRPKVSVEKLSRRRRQAGPPPPPPGANPPPPPGPAGPGYAPNPEQPSAGTISFGGLIGDSFSRSGTQTQHSFMTSQDFQQSMGGSGGPITGEALSEVSMTGSQQMSSGLDMTGYPPDMMLAPGPPGPGAGGMDPMGGPLTESIFLDQTLPVGSGSLLGAPVDASPSSFIKPGIPRPPKQSSAELEAAIVGAPMLTSAVSDTQVSTNAADLVGASYIPELSEGRSNQAETSTAARHGTMIVPVEHSKISGGHKAEYLSGSKGTSMRETAADTRAEIRSATMSLARFGYQPTAEQVLSGNIGIHHPTENLDTTNLEPIGTGPNNVAGAAAPGILSAILGGQPTQVTDASLDPAVKKTREDLIRQLGEAMGVIGTSKTGTQTSNIQSLISMDNSAPTRSSAQEKQQIVNVGSSQQLVNTQPGGMGITLDGGMFGGNSMMNMGMGMGPTLDPMTGGQVTGGGMDMLSGLGLDMQTMDLQSLFGAADAAVNNQPVALPQVAPQNVADTRSEQSMFGQTTTQSKTESTQTKPQSQPQRQPQTARDLIDIGMPGMTIEEMMTLLNMEQQGGAAASTSGAAAQSQKQPTPSSAPSQSNVAGMDMESAMMGGTTSTNTKQSSSSVSMSSSSSSASSGSISGSSSSASNMENMMFGANSINEKPSNSLIGHTAQSLSEMSTTNLEALLAEATGNTPKQERISNSATSISSSSSSSSSSSAASALGQDALLTAPLDKLSTAELEALLNSNPTPEVQPTPSAVPLTSSQASVDFGFAPEPTPAPANTAESRETTMIKTALKRAVFDATGTEFDFSQMTQAEMNDMVQMFGGLQNLQQYMTPDMFAPEPINTPVAEPVTQPPTPAPEPQIVQPQPSLDVSAGNAATGIDTANLDFATMQQFLNPTMFGPNFGFGQQNAMSQGTDLHSMMNVLNPTGAPLNQVDTISLADLLSGNINMGQQSGQSSSMTVDQSSQTIGNMNMNFDQFAQLGGNMGQASQAEVLATQTNEAQMTSGSMVEPLISSSSATSVGQVDASSSTSQNQITGTENMIWDPVQMQWISPDGTLVKDTSAAVEQTIVNVQPALPDQSATLDQTQQQSIASEMGASSSSTSITMETSMSGSMQTQSTGVGTGSSAGEPTLMDVSPIVGGVDTSMTVDTSASSSVSGTNVDTQGKGIAQSNLSDLIPVGEQVSAQMTEKASPSTANVDPSPTASTAGSDILKAGVPTTSSPVVESPRPPIGKPNPKEVILFTHEMKKKQELELLLQRQREELQRLEEQRLEQRRRMMAEKQRIEYEKQQLALKKQQMEVDALRQEQVRQRQMLEQQRRQLKEERMRIENQRLKELEMAKQKAIEEEKRRIREEQQRLREIEMAKKQAAEMERKRIEAERRKNAQAELNRRRAAEAERLRIEEERRRLEEERMRQEAAAAAAAKAKAEAEAAAAAAAAAKAEIEAREAAAAAMVVGMDTGVAVDTTGTANGTTGNGTESFTPIGAVGGQLIDADAATAMAWQAVVKAAQIQATGGAADPNAMITQQQEQLMQHQNLMNALQTGQGLSPEWIKILEQAAGVGTTPAPTTPSPDMAAMAGMDPAALMKLLQGQTAQAQPATTTPAPPTTTPKPKRKVPIRPDPNTRDFVRNMFIDNIKPGVDPLSILIGLTPEMLMKSGVNPLIANSADLARIVPAVERALGISLKKIPVPTGPRGQPLTPQPTGFQMLNVRSGPGGPGGPGSQRREFLMQQRMMGEMMTMLGLGPEPLEPGDPGYRGPGGPGGRGGRAGAASGALGGHSFGGAGEPLGGHSFGGAGEPMGGHSFGGAGEPMGGGMGGGGMGGRMGGGRGGAQGGLSAQLEMLGL
ncbi:hypothetical protein ACF0H5_024009 [Mactra antiquata]